MFCTSNTQAININENHSLQGTGKQNSLARFRVYKVSTGGVRMFESMADPGHFIRMKEGKIDVLVRKSFMSMKFTNHCSVHVSFKYTGVCILLISALYMFLSFLIIFLIAK